ncbi:conserved hypothetical protein [Theileria orientalis strain Shintoku]|uniref:Uncharacterized protein n=1 Tax=Theileria orientalis strain Shintoku TaxID=869250 RepID=J4C7D3_THEOR|nr:conserved hypothetical protein [Theileria orientalis strain Shintoku]PVC52313.1 hypothetical protein MACL_00000845 [Theileria orientalis]BAM38838.1 conserved hypothetical protein [Theileria orientalis strain Shintoku]|eukprot:XP_009689139.1 conserved hypothetical protein [Theileria orientalis strain Shintoku]
MITVKKSLVLLLISNFVGDIISSSPSSILVKAVEPPSPIPTPSPRKIARKQCHGNCDCARYSHYDVPKSLKSFGESEERPPLPKKRRTVPKIPNEPPALPPRNYKKKELVENPVYASIKPSKSKPAFNPYSTKETFYTSYGFPVEQDLYEYNPYGEPIYSEIDAGNFTKEHAPAGYSEHIYSEPYELPAPPKTKYQKFKDNAGKKLGSLKKSAKGVFAIKSNKPKESAEKTKKGATGVTLKLTKKSLGAKKVSAESPSETQEKINKATKELLREADKLASKLNESTRPRFYDAKGSTSSAAKGTKYKTKRELKKTYTGFSDIGRDFSGEARNLRKAAKAKLQGAKDDVKEGFDKFKDDLKTSALKGSESVASDIADQIGDFGNAKSKLTMETFRK